MSYAAFLRALGESGLAPRGAAELGVWEKCHVLRGKLAAAHGRCRAGGREPALDFEACDAARVGLCGRRDFEGVLTEAMALPLSAFEVNVVCFAFMSRSDPLLVDYREFLRFLGGLEGEAAFSDHLSDGASLGAWPRAAADRAAGGRARGRLSAFRGGTERGGMPSFLESSVDRMSGSSGRSRTYFADSIDAADSFLAADAEGWR